MRYKAVVSYDGTNYCGWQNQNNGISVQSKIEQALNKITNTEIKIHGSGRTDGGVHALGQCFHFDCEKTFADFPRAINSQLPDDIFIKSIEAVDEDFHARFSAKGKHYDYLINDGIYNPIDRNHVVQINKQLDVEYMNEVKKILLGTHDFTSFNATKIEEIENQVRTIDRIDIVRENGIIKISYYGDGFLRYMVRMLSQTLIEAGLHKISEKEIVEILNSKNKTACHYNGKPNGLYLVEVFY